MDGGRIQTVLGLGQPQEARALLIRLGAEALDLFQLGAGGERPLLLAPCHDVFGRGRADTRHAAQQRRRGGVQVHADTVHAVLDHAVQRLVQPLLGHVVLVLADTDTLRVDLDQLGQRVLQAAGNRHGAAQVDIILRELLSGQLGRRIDRGTGLADDHILQVQVLFLGQLADDLGGKLLGLMAGRAVADGHDLNTVVQNHRLDGLFGLIHPLELGHRVDDIRVQHLAGGVHDRHLAAHAVAGVQPHDRFAADGRLQQQLAQVIAKDLDRTLGGSGRQLAAQLVFKAGVDQAAVGIAGGGIHNRRAGTAGLFAGKHPADDARCALGIDLNADLQKALALAAVQRQHTVAGNLVQRLGKVVILGVDAVLILGLGTGDAAKRAVVAAQLGAAGGIVGDSLGNDVLRTGQRGGGIGHLIIEVRGGGLFRVERGVLLQNRIGQRLQAARLGNAGAGLALGLVGAVEILDLGQRFGLGQGSGQLGRHGPLLGDGGGDLRLALIEAAQIFQTVAQIAQHLIVHRAGGLLAVAGDERNGIALIDQLDRALHIFDAQVQFLC